MRRILDAVGGLYRESSPKRLGAALHSLVMLTELRAAAAEVIVDNRVSRLSSVGRVPASLSGMTALAGADDDISLTPDDDGRPRAGDRARRLRAEREQRAAGAAASDAAALGGAGSWLVESADDTDEGIADGATGGVVRRQVRPGGNPPVRPTAEGVPDIYLQPPTEGSGGLALIRSVYRENGLTTSLLGWRPAAFGGREVAIVRLYHPSVAWAIEPVRPEPGGVTGAVLDLLLTGLPEKEIAQRLNRSTHTIHAHVKRVYRHYGVRSRSELIVSHFRHHDEK